MLLEFWSMLITIKCTHPNEAYRLELIRDVISLILFVLRLGMSPSNGDLMITSPTRGAVQNMSEIFHINGNQFTRMS